MKISHLLLASMVVCSEASFAEQSVSEFNAEKSASQSTQLDENKLSLQKIWHHQVIRKREDTDVKKENKETWVLAD